MEQGLLWAGAQVHSVGTKGNNRRMGSENAQNMGRRLEGTDDQKDWHLGHI